jgi:DnaJ-domain-containing protein 1
MEQQTLRAELQAAFALRLAADQQVYAAIARLAEVMERGAQQVTTPARNALGPLYNVKETCALLGGICRDTLWRLRRTGKIEFIRIGNRPLFAAEHIEAYRQRLLNK